MANPPKVGDTGVEGVNGEEGVDDEIEETEFENAAEEVEEDVVEENDPERPWLVLLFTGVLYIGGDENVGEAGDLLPVMRLDTGIREIPNSFKLPRAFRRLGLVPFALSKMAPDQIEGIAVAV